MSTIKSTIISDKLKFDDIKLVGIEILDISYVFTIYFVFGYHLSIIMDKIFVKIFGTNHEKKSRHQLLFEILIQTIISGISIYFIRNFVKQIPFPLNNTLNYDHSKLSELTGGALLNITFFTYQKNLQLKMTILRNNFSLS